jgi:hypothetical protein
MNMKIILGVLLACTALGASAQVIDATTANGERVRLMPDGRWEYVDQKKAAVQQEARKKEQDQRDVELKRERSAQGGGLLGIGRTLYEGDKDYNRGSLNPKMR